MPDATIVELRRTSESRARGLEVAFELRAAAADGDEPRIHRLVSDLLRLRAPKALQVQTVQHVVSVLRRAVVHDEVTGLLNWHGFVQSATRLLDLAQRNRQPHHLIYLQLGAQPALSAGSRRVPARNLANLMRDVFAGYGVYEVLGRLSATEFAALSPGVEFALRDSTVMRLRRADPGTLPVIPIGVGISHFDPSRPLGVDELLEKAQWSMQAYQRIAAVASPGLAPA